MDSSIVAQWSIPFFIIPLPEPVPAHSLNGTIITTVSDPNPPVNLIVSGNHLEVTTLHLLKSPSASIVLGYPWVVQHGPHMDWSSNTVLSWSQFCLASCLGAASFPVSGCPVLQVEAADLTGSRRRTTTCVRCSARATSLPPHRPYDCVIYILPGTSPPKCCLFSLSGPEREACFPFPVLKERLVFPFRS